MSADEPQLKKCPYCAELIQPEAVLCRFCKSDLNTTPSAPAGAIQTMKRDLTRLNYCLACGGVDTPKRIAPGNFLLEVVLWFFFLVPGLIYSIWRITSKYTICRLCRSTNVVPGTSPEGRKNIERLYGPQ